MRVFNVDTVPYAPEALHPVARMSAMVRAYKVGPNVYQHFKLLVLCSDNKIYAMPVKCVEKTDTEISFACCEVPLVDSLIKVIWIIDHKGRLLKDCEFENPRAVEAGKQINLTIGVGFPC